MNFWMPTGFPGPSSMKSMSPRRLRTGLPSYISNFSFPELPMTCSGGTP